MKIVLVGASGYGGFYLKMLQKHVAGGWKQLVGVIDPFARSSPRYLQIREAGIPTFDDLEDFYAQGTADLAIISSPIAFHKQQVLTAISHHSNVLCEKPLVPILQDAMELKAALAGNNTILGVGFQWSFSRCMRALKKDILDGTLGRPISLKAHISWQRFDNYYSDSDWKGRIRDKNGNWVLDSILSNATAHYLHNIFYLMGSSMETAGMPQTVYGSLYRGKAIESFDTCFLRGSFAAGAVFYYVATHSGEKDTNPRFEYSFENAVVYFDQEKDDRVYAVFRDGSEKIYGSPQTEQEEAEKINFMLDAIRKGGSSACSIETVLPHLAVCNAVFDRMNIASFPAEMHLRQEEPKGEWIRGLFDATLHCYEEMLLPDELEYAWAAPSVTIPMAQVDRFDGSRFPKNKYKGELQ